MTTAVHYINKY